MMNSTIRSNTARILISLSAVAFCLAVWQIAAVIIGNSYFLPTIPETAIALANLFTVEGFYVNVLISLGRVALGLICGIALGIALGVICYAVPFIHSFVSPLISIMKATPIAAIILILWFALSDTSLAVAVVVLMIAPIIFQNVYDGFKAIPHEMKELCEAYEFTFAKKMRLLVFPTVSGYLIPAIITSIGLSWKAEIASEIMTYSNIGRSIQDFKSLSYDTASVYAWAIVIVAISIALETAMKFFLRRIRV